MEIDVCYMFWTECYTNLNEHNDMTYNASNYNIYVIIWFMFYHAIKFFI